MPGFVPPFLTAASLSGPEISHGFFGREGGVSGGIYASLNLGLGSGDARESVLENRARVRRALGAEHLLTLYQIHSAEVVTVTNPWTHDAQPRADAMVTDRPGILLGILTADCAPVLFSDQRASVIGAAHAGWQGAAKGVLEATVAAMEKLGARRENICAAIGPCIAQKSYEIGVEFQATLCGMDPANILFFSVSQEPRNGEGEEEGNFRIPPLRVGHFLFDLSGYVVARLKQGGITQVEILGHDTCAEATHYFSYRRTTLQGEADYGRQVSTIMLRAG